MSPNNAAPIPPPGSPSPGLSPVAARSGPVPQPALDETMLAMDVVDTLRHAEHLVERELQGDARRDQLKHRLREIYTAQGIEVPDRILDQGVAALEEHRFVYRPTPPSFSRSIANLWVTRGRWGRGLALGLGAILLASGGWWFGVRLPAERAQIAQQEELSTGIPSALRAERERIAATTQSPELLGQAGRLVTEGEAAARAGALADARDRLSRLQDLRRTLAQEYTVRIVSGPGDPSGVWRVPPNNPRGRNFYLIVEAVDPSGRPVEVPITSEEDGGTATVSRWGLRVTPEQYERVRRDKMSDGVIQDPVVGQKRAGQTQPNWTIGGTGGAILQW